uniref:Metalloendopeptidase n=1 Tax=Strigamia maritima TaxID=126957 RepID=T1IKW2_STRMM
MIMDDEQLEDIEGLIDTRKGKHDEKYRWPNALVQFRLDDSSVPDRVAIMEGIQHWEDNSCVRFVEVGSNYNEPHLIFRRLNGCYSHVGRAFFKKQGQVISIGPGCTSVNNRRKTLELMHRLNRAFYILHFTQIGTVAHEIGHALGFHHEQSRPDRDDYVVVLDRNINRTMIHNFRKESVVSDHGVGYDMGSVMHYGIHGFSINGKNTLVTKDPFKHFLIGQRESLSFADIKLANLMYKCGGNDANNLKLIRITITKRDNQTDKCGNLRCNNGGFVNGNCRCVCPPGFSGANCQRGRATPEAVLTCGEAVNRPTTIRSPNYPRNYPKNSKCVWVITAPIGRKVRAQFKNFEMMRRWEGKNRCVWDIFEFRYVNLHDGIRYCGTELRGETVTSVSNTMVFVFSSQSNYFAGFEVDVDFLQQEEIYIFVLYIYITSTVKLQHSSAQILKRKKGTKLPSAVEIRRRKNRLQEAKIVISHIYNGSCKTPQHLSFVY